MRSLRDGDGCSSVYGYDGFDRRTSVTEPGTDAGPETTQLRFDPNGNVEREILPRDNLTRLYGYDAADRLLSETSPIRGVPTGGDPPAGARIEKTSYTYDANSNLTSRRRPRGNLPGLSDAQREYHTTRYTYTPADELASESRRLDTGDRTLTSTYGYDADGNQTLESHPGAATDASQNRQITTRRFNGRDMLWTETTGVVDPNNSSPQNEENRRTTVTEFDGNGNLRRTVHPLGVNRVLERPAETDAAGDPNPTAGAISRTTPLTRNATVREYDSDNLLVAIHLPVDTSTLADNRRFRQDFTRDLRGRVTTIDGAYDWSVSAPKTARTSYTHYDNGWIKTVSDQHVRTPDGAGVTDIMFEYRYDRRGDQAQWSTGAGRRVDRAFFPNGLLKRRSAVKTVDGQTRSYDYAYNTTGSLKRIVDNALTRTTTVSYDDSERRTVVNEVRPNGHDTALDYDHDGNLTRLRVDGGATTAPDGTVASYTGGKSTSFDFDSLGREKRADVAGADRTTTTEYWPFSDLVRSRSKSNGVQETFEYLNDGRTSRMRRLSPGGAETKNQVYEYDRNGNRTRDERGTYLHNARDQLAFWQRPSADGGTLVGYEHNGSGAIIRKGDGKTGKLTVYCYQDPAGQNTGDRLAYTRESSNNTLNCTNTVTAERTDYEYDQFGSVKTIDPQTGPSTLLQYDEFERLTRTRRSDQQPSDPDIELFAYDGLDRRDKKTVDGKTFEYSYVALTEKLSRETTPSATGESTITRSYDYNSDLERLGQTRQLGTQPASFRVYGKDAVGSVEQLEDENGTAPEDQKYKYDPYGDLTNQPTGIAAEAPFRFEGFCYDPGSQTYDMQARAYRPQIGRFLSQDRYEAASGDLALQSDPLTQNRYAFGAGNPIMRVETDGHIPAPDPRGTKNKGLAEDISNGKTTWSKYDTTGTGPPKLNPLTPPSDTRGGGGYRVALKPAPKPPPSRPVRLDFPPPTPTPCAEATCPGNPTVAVGAWETYRFLLRHTPGGEVPTKIIDVIERGPESVVRSAAKEAVIGALTAAAGAACKVPGARTACNAVASRVTGAIQRIIGRGGTAPATGAANDVASPSVPYGRAHYGGSATNSPAGNAARAASEGQRCSNCGKPQVSGTRTAPWPQHEPPLVKHYYNERGWQMTSEQARAYARSEEAINGTLCATCQRSEGGTLSAYSKKMKDLWGLE